MHDREIEVECDNCGIKFPKTVSHVKRGNHNFCTRICYGEWVSKNKRGKEHSRWSRIEVRCEYCGNILLRTPSRIRKARKAFCNRECHKLWKREHPKRLTKIAKPTKPERIFQGICKKYNLPFRYVGDGQLWIGKKKKLNPDFIECNGKKVVIEVMGAHWHSLLLNPKVREEAVLTYRKKHFRRFGWRSVFFWDTDLLRTDAEQFVLNTLEREGIIETKGDPRP